MENEKSELVRRLVEIEDEDEDYVKAQAFRVYALESINIRKELSRDVVELLVLSHRKLGLLNHNEVMDAALMDLRESYPNLTRRELGDIFLGEED